MIVDVKVLSRFSEAGEKYELWVRHMNGDAEVLNTFISKDEADKACRQYRASLVDKERGH